MRRSIAVAVVVLISITSPGQSADLVENLQANTAPAGPQYLPLIKGRAAVVSGDTLWFPQMGIRVRLDGIEACLLPQWAFDPTASQELTSPAPVPCGALAQAWLKRVVDNSVVHCTHSHYFVAGEPSARCFARGRALGLEMLRVGWARTVGQQDPAYLAAERYARSARYGLWGTYVLDMGEWRKNAIDQTIARLPIADLNLLAGRKSEFTPPFGDWRNRPRRTDR